MRRINSPRNPLRVLATAAIVVLMTLPASPAQASPKWTLQVDPLTTALGFLHLQLEYAIAPPVSVYIGPSLHLFPGILAEKGEAPYTGVGAEVGVRAFFYGEAPAGGWVMLRGVLAHLSLDNTDITSVGGYVSLLAGYTWIYDDWFVLSGGLGIQYLDYTVGGTGLSGVLPAAHTALGVAF